MGFGDRFIEAARRRQAHHLLELLLGAADITAQIQRRA